MTQDIDLQSLHQEVDKLQTASFAISRLQSLGQTDFSNTIELMKITNEKIRALLNPPLPDGNLDNGFDEPELGTLSN